MNADVDQVKSSLHALFNKDELVELRAIADRRIINGYYRDFNKLAVDACTLNSDFNPKSNVYVCLNPIKPTLYARRADHFGAAKKGEGTRDTDIVCRRWLLIDIDPVRPSGVSATHEQKEFAGRVASRVHKYLQTMGFPDPVCADSGNGAHLLLRLADWPNERESRWICERFLKLLSDQFATETAKIDQSTFNAARITKLYGTVARKGSDVPEQPHRLSKLLHVPDKIVPIDLATVAALTGSFSAQAAAVPVPTTPNHQWDIEKLLQDRGLEYSRDNAYVTANNERATRFELPICPWNSEHQDNAAFIIQWPNGAVAAGCHHDGCAGNDWQTLKNLWGLTSINDITTFDIILPQMSSVSYMSLSSYITEPTVSDRAFYGPLGQIVARVAEDTEASAVSILAGSLMYLGTSIGRRCFVRLDQFHFPKLYVAQVGSTGTGRKGTSDVQAQRIIDAVDPLAHLYRHSGLCTGEGLLAILNENRDGMIPRPAAFIEREFAAVFRRAERRGNTLSSYIRDAWDDAPLANSAKADPIRITDHHVSICAHVTPAELKRLLNNSDVANGFAGRFLWMYCRRSGRKPDAKGFQAAHHQRELLAIQEAMEALQQGYNSTGEPICLSMTEEAKTAWRDHLYPELDVDADEDTQLVLMCNRQPQQVCRIASIFAVADGHLQISLPHLEAARALVEYCWQSLDYILSRPWWGDPDNVHDPAGMAAKALEALADGPKQRSYISHTVFGRNRTAKEINHLRDLLVNQGRIRIEQEGRRETWKKA